VAKTISIAKDKFYHNFQFLFEFEIDAEIISYL